MGKIRLLGPLVHLVGYMARKLLVALLTCSDFRRTYYQKGKVAVLEKRVQGR